MRIALIVSLAAWSALFVACSAGPTKGAASPAASASGAAGPIGASLKEWTIGLTASTAKAGTVKFSVRNDGKVPHDLVVVKSDLAADRLPTAGGIVDERQVAIVGRTGQLTPGDGAVLSLELVKGKYVLICNVIGHYNSGQFAGFTVQ